MYHQIGELVAMSVVQGGSGLGAHALSPSVYNYISGKLVSDIIVSVAEVPDPEVRDMLAKVCNTQSNSWKPPH